MKSVAQHTSITIIAGLLSAAAGAQTTDTTPAGMVSLFAQPDCPTGWSAYTPAEGRLLLGYTDTDAYTAEQTVGDALANATAPSHGHHFSTSVNVSSKGLAATSGSNHSGANPGSHDVPQDSSSTQAVDDTASAYPFVQRTVCRKDSSTTTTSAATSNAIPSARPSTRPSTRQATQIQLPGGQLGMCSPSSDALPFGSLAFFSPEPAGTTPACPVGWSKATYLSAWQVNWSGSNAYCVQIAFDGIDSDGDGILRGRGSDPSTISGGYKNELTAWSMTVRQNDCSSGNLLQAYSWTDQQARSDFNFNFKLDTLEVQAGTAWNTSAGLNAGIWVPGGSLQQYNFSSYDNDSGFSNSIQLQTEIPNRQTMSSTALGDDKFIAARQDAYVNGLLLVPFASGEWLGQTVGSGLTSGETVGSHRHDFSSSISLDEQKMVIASGSTEHLGTHGTHNFSGETSANAVGLPYVQLLLCQKCDDYAATLPSTLNNIVAYNANGCPTDATPQAWTPLSNDSGRFTIGLAPGAANPGKTFGGTALQALATATHQHKFSASVDIGSHGVKADNGSFLGAYEAYGHAGTRSYSGTSANTAAELPYLASAACRPCGGSGQHACD